MASHGPHDDGSNDRDDANKRTHADTAVCPETATAAPVMVPGCLSDFLPFFRLVVRASWWSFELLFSSVFLFMEIRVCVRGNKRVPPSMELFVEFCVCWMRFMQDQVRGS